jgi:hypothetical protein
VLPAVVVAGPWSLLTEMVAAALLLGAVLPLTPVPLLAPAPGFVLASIWPSTTAL